MCFSSKALIKGCTHKLIVLQDLEQLLTENKEAFGENERQIDTTPLVQMSVDTGDHLPIAKRPYTPSVKHYDRVREELEKLHDTGVVRESHSSWSAPIVAVPKGEKGRWLCIDFHALNAITRKYIWSMHITVSLYMVML